MLAGFGYIDPNHLIVTPLLISVSRCVCDCNGVTLLWELQRNESARTYMLLSKQISIYMWTPGKRHVTEVENLNDTGRSLFGNDLNV